MKKLPPYVLTSVMALFACQSVSADLSGPGWHQQRAPEVAPAGPLSDHKGKGKGGTGEKGGGDGAADDQTVDILALAKGLSNDPKLIYDFVRNQIDYVPYYGVTKGATLTLLEKSGNDFDQAALLVSLLKASGHSPNFKFGTMDIPKSAPDGRDAEHWLRGADANQAATMISSGGVPVVSYPDFLRMDRVWVEVAIGGRTYLLDPAFKSYQREVGIDLADGMGYNRADLFSEAGGTVGASFVQNVNRSQLKAELTDYSSELVESIRENFANATIEEVIGGATILESRTALLPTALPFPSDLQATWTSIPESYNTTVRFELGDLDHTMPTHQLSGKRLSLTFESGGSKNATLWLDDEVCVTETGAGGGAAVQMKISVDHPYPAGGGAYQDQAETKSYQRDAMYAILYGFGGSQAGGVLQKRQRQLDAYLDLGLASDSRQVVTESLNVIGMGWMKQTSMSSALMSDVAGTLLIAHHRFGRMGQEQGYYVDVGLQSGSELELETGDDASEATFKAGSFFASALEHAVIEHLQDNDSASTVKMLQVANDAGEKIYHVTQDNFDSVWATIRSNGGSNPNGYPDGLESQFRFTVENGDGVLILPENYFSSVQSWTGTGYVTFQDYGGGAVSQGMIISGGYFGGYAGLPGEINPGLIIIDAQGNPRFYDPETPIIRNPRSYDPIDLYTGSFVLDNVDLSTGLEQEPGGMNVRRFYQSRKKTLDAGMGNGWSHGYQGGAIRRSAPDIAMGDGTAVDAAAAIVGTYVALDLMDSPGNAKDWLVASLAAGWAVDELDDNAVVVSVGSKAMQFIELADGSYNSPRGIQATLTGSEGNFLISDILHGKIRFDADDRLSVIEDTDGNQLTLSYGANGLQTATDRYGRTLSYTYNSGRITGVTESAGGISRTVSYSYDAEGNLVSFDDQEGNLWEYRYDSENRLVVLEDPDDRILAINEYDSFDRVIRQHSRGMNGSNAATSPHQTWTYGYSDHTVIEQDPLGNETLHTFDARGRPTSVRNPLGETTQSFYDGQDHLIRMVDAKGNETSYQYGDSYRVMPGDAPGANHNLLAISRVVDGRATTVTRQYDAFNRVSSLSDAAGNTTNFTYFANHRLKTEASAGGAGLEKTYTYFEDGVHKGLLSSRTDVNGNTSSLTYDSFGNPDKNTRPGGLVTDFDFSPRGDLVKETGAEGRTTSYTFDDRRLLLSVVQDSDGLGISESTTYDASGNFATTTNRYGDITSYEYDQLATLVRVVYPNGGAVTMTLDRRGYQNSATDRRGRKTVFGFDDVGRKNLVISPAGDRIRMSHDASGNLSALTNEKDATIEFEHNEINLPASSRTALGFEVTKGYDNRGFLSSIVEASGQSSSITYDEVGRIETLTDGVGTIDHSFENGFSYSPGKKGLRHTVSEGGRSLIRTFDEALRMVSFTDEAGHTLGYEYYDNNLLKSITYPDGISKVTYSYDNANRLAEIVDWAGRRTSYSYYPGGHASQHRLWRVVRPNGTRREFAYNGKGELLQIREETSGGVTIHSASYLYDSDGRLVGETSIPPASFPGVESARMSFDADNRASSYNNLSLSYDADGNMTSGPLHGGAPASYSYDARNRLISAGAWNFSYDAENRRTRTVGAGEIRNYVHDPSGATSRLLQMSRQQGGATTTTRYVYDPHGLVYEEEENGEARYYHSDLRGSTVALTSHSETVTGTASYLPYGKVASTTGNMDTPFLYHGRYGVITDGSGLYHMRARYYHPDLRRFINADPLGVFGGQNLYQFVGGNPAMRTDSSGLWFGIDDLIFAAGGAIIGVAAQGVGDLISGEVSGWEDYTAAAVGGAVGAEVLLYTANPFLAGAAGGASSNLTKQGLKNLTGRQSGFDGGSFILDTGLGAATGFIPGAKVPGVTTGRNSYMAIFNSTRTKAINGTISRISGRTGLKMGAGAFTNYAVPQGAAAAVLPSSLWNRFFGGDEMPPTYK